jgi:hypothetical protein
MARTSKLDMKKEKKHQDMGKTFRILMEYCEYSVHKLNDCF